MKRRFSYADFDEIEKIRVYLEYHPEVLTKELMEKVADRFLNYLTVRKKIKEMWPDLCRQNMKLIDIIPNDYEEIKKLYKDRRP